MLAYISNQAIQVLDYNFYHPVSLNEETMTTRTPKSYPEPPLPKQSQEAPGLESELTPKPRYLGSRYKPAGKLEDNVALITGGDSGIGRSVAVLYAYEGADVAIVYLAEEQSDAEVTAAAVEKAGRRALLLPGDVRDLAFCERAVEQTVDTFGKLDILVNNAAVQKNLKSFDEISIEQWENTFRTNIFGYFYMVKAALPHLKEGSAIINTGSITGLEGHKELIDYSATKGAIHAFTKSLAQNLVDKKIRVNGTAPGPIWTPLNPAARPAKDIVEFGGDTAMKRPGQPEEVAPLYVFLASNADSSYITGEIISLLGGETTAA